MATNIYTMSVGPPPGIVALQDSLTALNDSLAGVGRSLGTAATDCGNFALAVERCAQRIRTAAESLNSAPAGRSGGVQLGGDARITAGTVHLIGQVNITNAPADAPKPDRNWKWVQDFGATVQTLGSGLEGLVAGAAIASGTLWGIGRLRSWLRGGTPPAAALPATDTMRVTNLIVTRATLNGVSGLGSGGGAPGSLASGPRRGVTRGKMRYPAAPPPPPTLAGRLMGMASSASTRVRGILPPRVNSALDTVGKGAGQMWERAKPLRDRVASLTGLGGNRPKSGGLGKGGRVAGILGAVMIGSAVFANRGHAQAAPPGAGQGEPEPAPEDPGSGEGESGGTGLGGYAIAGALTLGAVGSAAYLRGRRPGPDDGEDDGPATRGMFGGLRSPRRGGMPGGGMPGGGGPGGAMRGMMARGGRMAGALGGGMMKGGGKLLGTLFKGAKMFSPLGLGMMAGGMASTAVADGMAARGVEMPEPGGLANGVSMFTGFDPRLLQMGIDYLGTVPGLLGEAWTAITGVVGGWAESFGGFMNDIVTGAQNKWNGFINFFTVTLPGYFTSGAESLGGIMGTVGEVLGAAVQGVVDGVMFVFDGLVQYYTVFLPGMFNKGVGVITDIFDGLAGFFTETLPGAFSALGTRMVELKDSLIENATGAAGKVKEVLGGIGSFITETIPANFREFMAKMGQWRDSVAALAGEVVDGFVSRARGIGTFFLNTLPGMLRTGARGVIRALIDGLIAAAASIDGVGAMIAGKLADYLVGHSPTKEGELHYTPQGGRNVVRSWLGGAESESGAAERVGDTLASSLNLGLSSPASPASVNFRNALSYGGGGAASGIVTPAGFNRPQMQLGSLAPASTTEDPEKKDPAEKTGMIESFFQFDKMLGSVKTQFAGLMGSISPLAIVSTVLEGVFKGLQPAIDALKEPLRIVGEILGAALAPILEALFPVFKMIAIAATWVGQIFFTIAGAILTTVGALVKGLGKLISKLPGVGDFGLVKVGDGLINMGKGFKDSAKALAEGREKIKALEFGKTAEATQQTAEAATQANEALRNLPSGFKIALARYQVTTGEPVGLATATLPTGASTGAVAQDNRVTVQGNIVIQGADKDGRQLWEEMQREMQRQSLRQNGTTLGYAVAI